VRDSVGAMVPLVTKEMTLFQSTREIEASRPSSYLIIYLAIGLLLGSLVIVLRRRAEAGTNSSRLYLLLFAGLWNLFSGLLGTALAALWLMTNHVYSFRNENLFQANPLSLLLAVLMLASFRSRPDERIAGVDTARVARIVGALAALGFVIQILPSMNQVNGEIIALMMPVHVAIAFAFSRRELPFFGDNTAPTTALTR